jgi:CelD/BcsL family acetyltransferase involved in cellulose biosynthesis
MFQSDILADAAPIAVERAELSPPQSRPVRVLSASEIVLDVYDDLVAVEPVWRDFEKTAACTVFQSFGWLSKWHKHVGARAGIRPAIVTGRGPDGRLLFLFPLSVETRGALRQLAWLGHELCDYNGALFSDEFLRIVDRLDFPAQWRRVVARIRTTLRTRIDLIDLDKMQEQVGERPNPFAALDIMLHPSGAHIATLGENWDSFYSAKRSSATRKKERRKLKQLGEMGEVRFADATDMPQRAEVLDVLIEQKSRAFARMGVNDIFAVPGNREFFKDVATDPAMRDIIHVSKLDVGATVAATNLGLIYNGCYCLVLSSYQEGDISRFGPGRAHLHELLRYSMVKGLRLFDFTVGDEAYKLDWSDKNVKLYDYLEPVTIRGRLAVMAMMGFRHTKRFIKHTPILWRLYTMARSYKARMSGSSAKCAGDMEKSAAEAD